MILLTHVVCWVIKPLDIQVLECIEIMFEDQFEVVTPIDFNEEVSNNSNGSIKQ